MKKQVELYDMREPSRLDVFQLRIFTGSSFRSFSMMSQKVRIHPLVPLVSYAAWHLQYPHLNIVSSESALCLVFLRNLFNSIRCKLMSKVTLSAMGEVSMLDYLELAISSMKNLEAVK